MEKLRLNRNQKKMYYITPRILQFKNSSSIISDDDLVNMFVGFVRLIKKSTEIEIEDKYLKKIELLEKELRFYKKVN